MSDPSAALRLARHISVRVRPSQGKGADRSWNANPQMTSSDLAQFAVE
jgi:hypothetical protein